MALYAYNSLGFIVLGSSSASQPVVSLRALIGWGCGDALCILLLQPGKAGRRRERGRETIITQRGGGFTKWSFSPSPSSGRDVYTQHVCESKSSRRRQLVTAPPDRPSDCAEREADQLPEEVSPLPSVNTEQVIPQATSMPVTDPESMLSYQVKCPLNG